jgi:hypothetical protein
MSDTSFIYEADRQLFLFLRQSAQKAKLQRLQVKMQLGIMGCVQLVDTRAGRYTTYWLEAYDTGRVYVYCSLLTAIAETFADVPAAIERFRRLAEPGCLEQYVSPGLIPERDSPVPRKLTKHAEATQLRHQRQAEISRWRLRVLQSYELMLAARLPTLPPEPPYVPVPLTPEEAAARATFSSSLIRDMLAEIDRDIVRDVAAASD